MNHLPTYPPVSSSYEYIYGFNLLDDLHNFYPELMYDEHLFNLMPITWFQHRTSQLFPASYTRQQQVYRLYNAQTRRNMFDLWHSTRFPTLIPQAPPQTSPVEPAPTEPLPPATPILNAAPPRRRRQMTTSWFTFDTNPLLDTTLIDPTARFLVDILNGSGIQDDVVAPTIDEINAHSTIVDTHSIPIETSCSICQETNTSQQWRRLQCNHYYHRDCIDRWFLNHTKCPVCRADIRE